MRRRFKDQNCSIAQALEVLGDWWTLLVVREAFVGTRRFAELNHLVAHGVLARIDAGVHGTRYEYELTPMGKDLATLMTALQQWGDRWIYAEGHEPLLILDRRSGRRIPRLRILDNEGHPLAGRDMALVPGPGASKKTRARYGERLIRGDDGH